jgi:glycosyltransferase involved in cell wall biosynthesis
VAHHCAVCHINHGSHPAPLWSRFGLHYKTAQNKECSVATVCLLLLEFTSVYCFICCIADFLPKTRAVDENGQERRGESHARFERVMVLITSETAGSEFGGRRAEKSINNEYSFGRQNRLRVCFVSSYPPNHARLSEYTKNLVNEMAKRRIINDIHVLADMVNCSKNSAQEGPNIEVLRIWKPDDPFSILGILSKILKLKPDIVHFNVHFQSFGKNRLSNFVGLSLIFLCKLLNVKVVATVHNFGEIVDLAKVQVKSTFLNRIGIFVATKFVLSASEVVVKVRSYKNYLSERYGCKELSYIPHGTTVKVDPPSGSHEKVVLLFGHMGPHKGLPVLLDTFKEMMKEREDVKLVIAGSDHPNFPGYLESVKRGASLSKVDFLGYVDENDLAGVFETADVVVLPYLAATGTSGVFHLACGFGKPIIASDLPEIRELIAEGASAILVSPGDVKMLKNAILSILDDRGLRMSMERRNLTFAQRENWGVVAEAYEKVYLEAL